MYTAVTRLWDTAAKAADRTDRWLCQSLPRPLRWWWCRLWVRQEEFHPSTELDGDLHMRYGDPYLDELIRRRDIAHKRSIEVPTHDELRARLERYRHRAQA
jgi:hypothetical protein